MGLLAQAAAAAIGGRGGRGKCGSGVPSGAVAGAGGGPQAVPQPHPRAVAAGPEGPRLQQRGRVPGAPPSPARMLSVAVAGSEAAHPDVILHQELPKQHACAWVEFQVCAVTWHRVCARHCSHMHERRGGAQRRRRPWPVQPRRTRSSWRPGRSTAPWTSWVRCSSPASKSGCAPGTPGLALQSWRTARRPLPDLCACSRQAHYPQTRRGGSLHRTPLLVFPVIPCEY